VARPLFLYRIPTKRTKYDTDDEASETLTELDTDIEEQLQEFAMV
jgi:hypothetical protein